MSRFGSLGTQYFDNSGDVLTAGKIYFYESGTSTPKNTYADVDLTTANTNPVILTAAGRQPNIFFDGVAKGVLTDSDDVIIETRDPIGDTGDAAEFDPWVEETTYSLNQIVTGPDGLFYISLQNGNQGNTPANPSEWWTQIKFFEVWNDDQTYAINDIVQASNGYMYRSTGNGNTGNNPVSDGAVNWVGVVTRASIGLDLTTKGSILAGDGTEPAVLTVGTNGQILVANSAETTGLEWQDSPVVNGDYEEFLASGTWTKPDGAVWVYVECIGGGGSGRFDTDSTTGGGGGGYNNGWLLAADITDSVAVTVGAGGIAITSTSTPTSGNNGGSSSFGAYITAPGGGGGNSTDGGTAGGGEKANQGGYSSGGGATSSNTAGSCIKGGAGGGAWSTVSEGPAGTSQDGGNGGAGAEDANATAGSQPGGGGGGIYRSAGGPFTTGAGGAGRVRVRVIGTGN